MLYKAKENADLGVKGCGVVGNGEIYGYELTETFFVDNSGFGSDSEMALTFESFLSKVKAGRYYGIKEAGQFQVYIGEYKKLLSGQLKKIKDDSGIFSSKKVKNNTRLTIYKNGDKVLRLHNTDIIKWQDNTITLNSGGYDTKTTRARFNEFLPGQYRIFRKKGITYISNGQYSDKETETQFFDGIELSI